ncbi:hypothetical protein Pth03_69810 [Planotetraspora thailandica]|uniref:Uncharacterized protein n=1 Tax=Planotetraspora thailandica TaxID=487172 RepID=A0A8J4DEV1_9ACTN|nr:hypothetical protein Pth03_69810 [Planotetraspora thailandica]
MLHTQLRQPPRQPSLHLLCDEPIKFSHIWDNIPNQRTLTMVVITHPPMVVITHPPMVVIPHPHSP